MIQRKILKNGMTVIFKQRKNKVISVAFAVRFGAANEKAEHKGIAHFIEHMLYKGTPTRDSKQISTQIEKNGGELNGFTSEQITAFWCKMPSKHLDVALEVLSDMVKNPLFDEEELNKERQVIFEEMKMYHDNPQRYVLERIKSMLYTGDFSIPIIGTIDSMNSNSQERLKEFFKRVYVPENMILCVVGDTNFDKLCKFAEKNFESAKKSFSKPEVSLITNSIIEKRKEIDQANLVFAYHIPKPNEKMHYAALVLNTLLAGGMSSRLFSEIREKRNLAYAVKCMTEAEKDYAYNCIYIGTRKEHIDKVKEIILMEFEKVSKKLSEKELNEVKEQIIGNYLISQEDSHFLLLNYLIAEITGNANDADKFVENIKNVKISDVRNLARIKNYGFFALVPE
ncbi:MAG TPA: pitrilysin family protein [Candidatus Paceibacterota bacterium]|nr:pitrilysin family protein [Candidatus Paceibacterota bacterium]